MDGSLRTQIDPSLNRFASSDPDMTFRQYVESLLGQTANPQASNFSSAFTGAGANAGAQQPSTPTQSITEGMFSRYLNDGGGGGDSAPSSSSAPTGPGQGLSVDGLNAASAAVNNSGTLGTVGSTVAGLLGLNVPSLAIQGLAHFGGLGYMDQQSKGIADSFAAMNNFSSVPGIMTVSDADGNVIGVSNPASIGVSDHGMFGAVGTSAGVADTSNAANTGMGVTADGTTVSSDATVAAQDAAVFGGSPDASSGGGGGGGGKIVCTAMNNAYGFGSFRQAVWLQYSKDNLSKAHEVGYHAMFLPLVDIAYKQDKWYSKPTRKVLEHIARHRTADLRAEMRNTKRDTLGRAYRFVLEPLCYVVGKLKGY